MYTKQITIDFSIGDVEFLKNLAISVQFLHTDTFRLEPIWRIIST